MPAREYLLYVIHAKPKDKVKTYVGITNNFKRRLRQHRGIIAGGARFTRGCSTWKPVVHVTGLTKTEALQLEWAMKHKRFPGVSGVEGRLKTLERLMKVERWTRRAPALASIKRHLKIIHFSK